jgi:NADH-quinone oxidoreductase subunit H
MYHADQPVLKFLYTWWPQLTCALVIAAFVPLLVAYLALVERKGLAHLHSRLVPIDQDRKGLLQSVAGSVKLLLKEDIVPKDADELLFWFAPIISTSAALISLSALYFGPALRVAEDINIGILFVIGIGSLSFLGILLDGGASDRHTFSGVIRRSAQLISYGIVAALAIVSGVLLSGTLKIRAIVDAQLEHHVWFIFLAPFAFLIYCVASIPGADRSLFHPHECESERDACPVAEPNGFRSFFCLIGEYTSIIVAACVATTLFLGGWLRPFPNVHWLYGLDFAPALFLVLVTTYCIYKRMWAVAFTCFIAAVIFLLPWILPSLSFAVPALNGAFWFLFKVSAYIYVFIWLRIHLPRYRFDQHMHLSWQVLIPLAIVNLFFVGVAMLLETELGWNRWFVTSLTTLFTLAVFGSLVHWHDQRIAAGASALLSDSYAR